MTIQVVVFSRFFPPAYQAGGPVRSIEAMVERSERRHEVAIVSSAQDLDGSRLPGVETGIWTAWEGAHVLRVPTRRGLLGSLIRSRGLRPGTVYINSLFDPLFGLLPVLLLRLGLWPHAHLAVAPRGELARGALGLKSRKKGVVLALVRALGLYASCIWHASSEAEAEDIRRVFPEAEILVRGNDTLLPSSAQQPAPGTGRLRIAFVGRVSPVKGLDILLEALNGCGQAPDVDLEVYGSQRPDEHAYAERCRLLAAELPSNVRVHFHGAITHDDLLSELASCDLMALPTAGENFGHAIAEALSASCPVMIPPTTTWTEAAAETGTLVADRDVSTWSASLDELFVRPAEDLAVMRRLAGQVYDRWVQSRTASGTLLDELRTRPQHRSVALVTQGYTASGGVQSVARWLVAGLEEAGISTTVYDLATSSRDTGSRRITKPSTWARAPRLTRSTREQDLVSVGANAVELEPMRYLPRRQLTRALARHDLVQVVAGGPSLALSATRAGRPIVLQMATSVRWERASINNTKAGPSRWWSVAMTTVVAMMEPRALRAVDAVMVENDEARALVERQAPSVMVRLAPPGVDTDLFHPLDGPWSPTRPIVSVGRLNEPRKGFSRMLETYRDLRDARPDAPRLVLAGRGDPTPLRDEARRLGIEDVEVLGDLDPAELRRLLREASIFWQTSYEEGLGIAVIEAMASGIPVVATSTAGTEMTVDEGVTGFLVPQDDDLMMAAMVARTSEILDGAGDALARQARRRATSDFSTQATLVAFLDAYERLLTN